MSTLVRKSIRLSLLVCIIATIGHSTVAMCAQASTWRRYQAEGFSVLLPEPPSTTVIALPSKLFEKHRTAQLFSAYEDHVVYVILAFDNPKRRDPLSRFVDEISEYNVSAKAERFQQELSGAGFTGKEYGFAYGPTLNGIVRFYLTSDRVYLVEAVGDDVTKPAVKQFLDSFLPGGDGARTATSASPATEPILVAADPTAQPKPVVYSGKDVAPKARVLVKPEPMYTEAARKAGITGTVVIRGIFTSTGRVKSLRAVSGLPNGLTEQALEAAKHIRFIPALKDGRPVSMHIQLEYSFNLY